MTPRMSLPARTLAAAVVSGISGLALARVTALVFANIAVPSFERALLPGGFAYGAPPNWTGVALYRQATTEAPTSVPLAVQLVAASAPDANGRFAFSGLPAAVYGVGVLLPERFGADPKRLAVRGSLRAVDLSKERRSDDVGGITVSLRDR